MNLHRMLQAPESARELDRPAAIVATSVRRVLGQGRLADWARGSFLGHPIHPVLVALPIGAWSSAAVMRVAGRNDTARQLVLIGLLAVPPTVATGLVDFPDLDTYQRRVGVVHAAANTVATLFFSAAYRSHDDRRSTVFGAAGLAMAGAGGALGGHLAYALGAGVHRWQNAAAPAAPSTVPVD